MKKLCKKFRKCSLTFWKRGRICADHDVLVEGALEVSGEPIENAVLSDLESSSFVPKYRVDIEILFVETLHCTNFFCFAINEQIWVIFFKIGFQYGQAPVYLSGPEIKLAKSWEFLNLVILHQLEKVAPGRVRSGDARLVASEVRLGFNIIWRTGTTVTAIMFIYFHREQGPII